MRRGVRVACLVLVALACGCDGAARDRREPLQGVVEREDHVIGFEVAGRVLAVDVDRGDGVKADAVVARLDDSLLRPQRAARAAELEAARAQLALLEAGVRSEEIRSLMAQLRSARAQEQLLVDNLARQRDLFEHHAVSQTVVEQAELRLSQARGARQTLEQQLRAARDGARSQELDAARAQVHAVEAALATVDAQLERFVQKADVDGEVVDVHVRAGEMVAPGMPAVTIADLQHPYVEVFVPEGDLDGIRLGGAARCRVDSQPRPFDGRVEHIYPRTEFTPRFLFSEDERPNLVIRVRIRLQDPTGALHAGVPAFCDVDRGTPAGGGASEREASPGEASESAGDGS